jgi:protein O-mannosyl-transferase
LKENNPEYLVLCTANCNFAKALFIPNFILHSRASPAQRLAQLNSTRHINNNMAKKNSNTPKPTTSVHTPPPTQKPLQNIIAPQKATKTTLWLAIFLFVFAFLLYANTLRHEFAFDDSIVIVENKFTQKGLGGIKNLATRDFFDGIYGDENMALSGGRYRPLSLVMFAVEFEFFVDKKTYQAGDAKALDTLKFMGHLLNVLFFALSVVLLFVLLQKWLNYGDSRGKGTAIAFLAALLFAAHPIHTEVVANIKSRDEIMALLLMLGALLALDKYIRPVLVQDPLNENKEIENKEKGNYWLWLALPLFFASMLSKEHTFAFVLLMPMIAWIFYPKATKTKFWAASIGFLVTAAAYFVLRYAMVGGFGAHNPDIMENPFVNSDFGQKFGTIGIILGKYFTLSVLPVAMSSDYSFNQIPFTTLGNPISLLIWLAYAGAGVGGLWLVYKRSLYGYAIWLFLLPLGPTTNILFNIGAPMAERFLYTPSWGICLAMAAGLVQLSRAKDLAGFARTWAVVPVLALLAGYVILTVGRNPDWKNNDTLFAADVKTCPNSAKMQYYYGNTQLTKYLNNPKAADALQYLDKAEAAFLKSVAINPKFHTVIYNLGLVGWNQQDGKKAEKYLNMVLEMHPTHILSTELLGKVNARFLGNTDKAMLLLERAIVEFKRESADNYSSLGIVYAMRNDFVKATDNFKKALKITETDGAIWQNYAQICAQMGDSVTAKMAQERANALLNGK